MERNVGEALETARYRARTKQGSRRRPLSGTGLDGPPVPSQQNPNPSIARSNEASGSNGLRELRSTSPIELRASKDQKVATPARISQVSPAATSRPVGTGANWYPPAGIDITHGHRRASIRRESAGHRNPSHRPRRPPCRQGRLRCQSHACPEARRDAPTIADN
jgi:hypothetical protein